MKNRVISGIVAIVFGGLIALGPQYLFKICGQTHGVTACYWSAQAEIGIGAVFALLGIAIFAISDPRIRIGLSLSAVFNGVLAFAIVHFLIGVCEMPDMDCRLRTLPALDIITIAAILVSAANVFYLIKTSTPGGAIVKKDEQQAIDVH